MATYSEPQVDTSQMDRTILRLSALTVNDRLPMGSRQLALQTICVLLGGKLESIGVKEIHDFTEEFKHDLTHVSV